MQEAAHQNWLIENITTFYCIVLSLLSCWINEVATVGSTMTPDLLLLLLVVSVSIAYNELFLSQMIY